MTTDFGSVTTRPPTAPGRHQDHARHVTRTPARSGVRGRDELDGLDVVDADRVKFPQRTAEHAVYVHQGAWLGVLDRFGAALPEPARTQPLDGVVCVDVGSRFQVGAGDGSGRGPRAWGSWTARAARCPSYRPEGRQDPRERARLHGSDTRSVDRMPQSACRSRPCPRQFLFPSSSIPPGAVR